MGLVFGSVQTGLVLRQAGAWLPWIWSQGWGQMGGLTLGLWESTCKMGPQWPDSRLCLAVG